MSTEILNSRQICSVSLKRLFFACLGLAALVEGCTSDPVAVEVPKLQSETVKSPKAPLIEVEPYAAAEPISNETVKQFPHLAAYEGQLLLSGGPVQMVLAGIPTSYQDLWQDGILALFEARVVEKKQVWRNLELTSQIQFFVGSSDQNAFFPIGILTDITPKSATLRYILQSHQSRDARVTMALAIDSSSGLVTAKLEDATLAPGKSLQWGIRPLPRGGDSQLIARDKNLAYGMTLYRSSSIVSLIATKPAQYSEDLQELKFTVSDLGRDFWEFNIGNANQLKLPYRIAQIRCAAKNVSCDQAPTKFAATAESFEGIDHTLFVRDQNNSFLTYTVLKQGTTQELGLYPQTPYVIEELSSEMVERARLTGQPEGASTLKLPNQNLIPFKLSWRNQNQEPARIFVKRKIDPFASTLDELPVKSEGIIHWTGYNEFMASRGPVEIPLGAGQYTIQVSNASMNLLCVQDFAIDAQNREFECLDVADHPSFPSFAPLDQETDGLPSELWGAMYGSSFALKNSTDEALSPIQVATSWDSSEGLHASLLPLTNAQSEQWQKNVETDSTKQIKQMIEFRDHSAPQAKITIGCISHGIGINQFREALLRLNADALTTFGCGTSALQSEFLQYADQLMIKRKKPIILLPAPLSRESLGHLAHPALGILPVGTTPAQIAERLEKGEFTLAQGAVISWNRVDSSREPRLQVTIDALKDVIPERLAVYSDGKLVIDKLLGFPLGQTTGSEEIVLAKARWARIEVWGRPGKGQNNMILATSNYIQL